MTSALKLKSPKTADFEIHPLTPERWPDFEDLFGKSGACAGCWCMYWRIAWEDVSAQMRKKKIKAIVSKGPAPGLLAYRDGLAVGWMQLTPRLAVPRWNSPRRVSAPERPQDASDPKVWGISCFFVRSGYRGQGCTAALIAAGIEHAKAAGARVIEACAMDGAVKRSAVGMFVGAQSAFARHGFKTIAERKTGRPLMRLTLRAQSKRP